MAIRRSRAPRPGEVLAYFSSRVRFALRPEGGRSGPQVRVGPAPCCGNAKHSGALVVNCQTGLWQCFACGARGNWPGLARLVGTPLVDPYQEAPPLDLTVYARLREKLRRPVSSGHRPGLLAYCQETRLISATTLDAWRVSTCGAAALRWPLHAWDGAVAGWTVANARVRRVLAPGGGGEGEGGEGGHGPRDWFEVKGGPTGLAIGNHLLGVEPAAWRAGRPLWADEWLHPRATPPDGPAARGDTEELIIPQVLKCRRVLIVEGQWDAMTAWQLGIPNVLSLPNGAAAVDASALLRYVPEGAEVWVATDMDAAGERAAEAFFAQLGSKVRRLAMPAKDLNDWLRETPGLTAEDVTALGRPAPTPRDPALEMIDLNAVLAVRPAEIVCMTPWPRLTRRLAGGFRAGQTTGLLAPSGVGKTTVANNIVAQALREQVKTGIIQLEGVRGEVLAVLKQQIRGWIQPDMTEDLERVYYPLLMISGLAGKGVTTGQTLKAAEEMMSRGAKLVVVDNWDYIAPPDARGSEIKARVYAKFQELCKSYEAHGFVVWQPNKVDRGNQVNSGNQKGMSTALQDADVYMTINRRGNTRRLEVEKARVPEEDGVASVVILAYEKETGCLEESKSQADLQVEANDLDIF